MGMMVVMRTMRAVDVTKIGAMIVVMIVVVRAAWAVDVAVGG